MSAVANFHWRGRLVSMEAQQYEKWRSCGFEVDMVAGDWTLELVE